LRISGRGEADGAAKSLAMTTARVSIPPQINPAATPRPLFSAERTPPDAAAAYSDTKPAGKKRRAGSPAKRIKQDKISMTAAPTATDNAAERSTDGKKSLRDVSDSFIKKRSSERYYG
jgi:hypothetical protein